MRNKFRAVKSKCNQGHIHDSIKEAVRCGELHLLQDAKVIKDLEIQKKYELIPSRQYRGMPNERAVNYIADFVYIENNTITVEDTKGKPTPDYIIKRKLFKSIYGKGNIIFKET